MLFRVFVGEVSWTSKYNLCYFLLLISFRFFWLLGNVRDGQSIKFSASTCCVPIIYHVVILSGTVSPQLHARVHYTHDFRKEKEKITLSNMGK